MKQQPLTPEMFEDWLLHPVTQDLRRVLYLRRRQRQLEWEEGAVLDLGKDTQMLLNAAAIGECKAYRFIAELDFEQLYGELEDEEHERAEAFGTRSSGKDDRVGEREEHSD